MAHENHQPRFGGPVDNEEQRDDDAHCHPNLDAPADRQRESKEHKRKVDPCSHPAGKRRVKQAQGQLKRQTDLQ